MKNSDELNVVGNTWIVYEFCPLDLQGLLQARRHLRGKEEFPFSIVETKSIVYQILKGLAWLHGQGIVHRDMKVGNLLIDRNGYVKLADLGLARYMDDGTNSGPYTKKVREK